MLICILLIKMRIYARIIEEVSLKTLKEINDNIALKNMNEIFCCNLRLPL